MALWARHTNTGNALVAATNTFSGVFNTITIINRSTNDIYFTSQSSQGTAADGVPTVTGNNTRVVIGTVGASWAIGEFANNQGTDQVTISAICSVTNSPFSIVAD